MTKGIIFRALIHLQDGQDIQDVIKSVELVNGARNIRVQTNLVRIYGELVREHPDNYPDNLPFVELALSELKLAIESTDAVVESIDWDVDDDFFV